MWKRSSGAFPAVKSSSLVAILGLATTGFVSVMILKPTCAQRPQCEGLCDARNPCTSEWDEGCNLLRMFSF